MREERSGRGGSSFGRCSLRDVLAQGVSRAGNGKGEAVLCRSYSIHVAFRRA